MTTKGPASESAGQEPQQPPKYHIDEAWFEQSGRSLQYMIECRTAETGEAGQKGSKRKKKSVAVSMADLAKIEGFVDPELPVLEAAFRLLLIHENKPMDVEQISQELAEHGIGIKDARSVRAETLIRILESDTYYGLKRVP